MSIINSSNSRARGGVGSGSAQRERGSAARVGLGRVSSGLTRPVGGGMIVGRGHTPNVAGSRAGSARREATACAGVSHAAERPGAPEHGLNRDARSVEDAEARAVDGLAEPRVLRVGERPMTQDGDAY